MVPSSGCCIFQSKVSLVQFLHKMNLLCLARMRERDSQCSSFSYKLSIEKKKTFQFFSFCPSNFASIPEPSRAFRFFSHWYYSLHELIFFFTFYLFRSAIFSFFPSCKFLSTFLILCDQFFCFVYSHELRKLIFYFPAKF